VQQNVRAWKQAPWSARRPSVGAHHSPALSHNGDAQRAHNILQSLTTPKQRAIEGARETNLAILETQEEVALTILGVHQTEQEYLIEILYQVKPVVASGEHGPGRPTDGYHGAFSEVPLEGRSG
jgi:hypothetical protein